MTTEPECLNLDLDLDLDLAAAWLVDLTPGCTAAPEAVQRLYKLVRSPGVRQLTVAFLIVYDCNIEH